VSAIVRYFNFRAFEERVVRFSNALRCEFVAFVVMLVRRSFAFSCFSSLSRLDIQFA
jgi:hypothetical protein